MVNPREKSPGPTSFSHQVGRETKERSALASENFDLRLQISMLEEKMKKKDENRRRLTADGTAFYDFSDEDAQGAGDAVSKEELDEMLGHYRSEIARLHADLDTANEEAAAGAAAAEAADMEASDADARVREAVRDAAVERRAAEDLQSKLRSVKADMQFLKVQAKETEAESQEAAKEKHAVALRVEGLNIEVVALNKALAAERKAKLAAEAENRGIMEKLRVAQAKLREMGTDAGDKRNDGAKTAPGCDGSCSDELHQLRVNLENMSNRYEAMASNFDLKRRTALENAANPVGIDMENTNLSVPGFELYERLCKKVRSGRRGSLVVLGDGRSREWRKIVLKEMNDGLVMLYRQSERLEDDRAQFVEKHCRFLLEQEACSVLEERHENVND